MSTFARVLRCAANANARRFPTISRICTPRFLCDKPGHVDEIQVREFPSKLERMQTIYMSAEFLQDRNIAAKFRPYKSLEWINRPERLISSLEWISTFKDCAVYGLKYMDSEVMKETDKSDVGYKILIGEEELYVCAVDIPFTGFNNTSDIWMRLWSVPYGRYSCFLDAPRNDRIKQLYCLASASVQDLIHRFEIHFGGSPNWDAFPDYFRVVITDKDHCLCILELARMLLDVKGLSWGKVWRITKNTISCWNTKPMPTEDELWESKLLQNLLPRHFEIINMIDTEVVTAAVLEMETVSVSLSDLPSLFERTVNYVRTNPHIPIPTSLLELFFKKLIHMLNKEAVASLNRHMFDDQYPHQQDFPLLRVSHLCIAAGRRVMNVDDFRAELKRNLYYTSVSRGFPTDVALSEVYEFLLFESDPASINGLFLCTGTTDALLIKKLHSWIIDVLFEKGNGMNILGCFGVFNILHSHQVHILLMKNTEPGKYAIWRAREWQTGEPRVNRVIFFGKNLNEEFLTNTFRGCRAT